MLTTPRSSNNEHCIVRRSHLNDHKRNMIGKYSKHGLFIDLKYIINNNGIHATKSTYSSKNAPRYFSSLIQRTEYSTVVCAFLFLHLVYGEVSIIGCTEHESEIHWMKFSTTTYTCSFVAFKSNITMRGTLSTVDMQIIAASAGYTWMTSDITQTRMTTQTSTIRYIHQRYDTQRKHTQRLTVFPSMQTILGGRRTVLISTHCTDRNTKLRFHTWISFLFWTHS